MSIYDRVHARADLDALRAARDITNLAAALNAETPPPLVLKQRFITARAILTGCVGGVDILTALQRAESNTAVGWALKFLGQDAGLDIGDPGIYPLLESLVNAQVLTAPQVAALKSMAMSPVVVTSEQLATELYNPDGTEK